MMRDRRVAAALALFFALFFVAAFASAQDRGGRVGALPSDPRADSIGSGRIIGTVRTADGHSIEDATIEARDVEQGTRHVSGHTDSRGSFALYNISPGTYEVTVIAGAREARERVRVASTAGEATVNFRLADPSHGEPKSGTGSTISFAQYQIPAKARSLKEKASQLMKQGKLDEARKKVNAALAVYPKFPEALTLRAMLQFVEGKQTEAIADFQQAIQYDASYALAYIGLGSALNSMERFNESFPILTQAERLAPDAWQAYFELARANLGREEFATALRNVNRASELQGGQQKESAELHLVRGYALLGLADNSQAAGQLEVFLAHKPNGPIADAARKALDQIHGSAVTASK